MGSKKETTGNWFSRHKIWTAILVLVVLIGTGGAMSGGDSADKSPQQTATNGGKADASGTKGVDSAKNSSSVKAEPKKERLTVDEGWTLDQSNPYMTKVVGTVSNNSDKDISGYIQVTFSAYDESDANVGYCLANANTIDANGKWKFEAMCSGSNIATVKFKDISGF